MPHLVPAVLVLEGVKYCRGYSDGPNSTGQLYSLRAIGAGSGDGTGNIRWGGVLNIDTVLCGAPNTSIRCDPKINLSDGNSIFGASDTVQPAGLYGLCLVRAYQA